MTFFILFFALVLDWRFGEPEWLWSRVPHPVVLFGKAVSQVDKRFNLAADLSGDAYRKGSLAIAGLIILALLAGFLIALVLNWFGWIGLFFELILVFTLLAQRSLHVHVKAVANGLREGGLEGGRATVAMIVGRDPQYLDEAGISRAAIESLAENFSDAVVAPAFWYLVFGLPGLFAYKMINTSDSMIGYRSEKYLWFGRSAAQIDDFANWLPARFSALLISAGTGFLHGMSRFKLAMSTAMRDAGLHRSPNAGWPEAAMAGGLQVALGGPRHYANDRVEQPFLNASGKRSLKECDIEDALDVFTFACFAFWTLVGLGAVLF